MGRAQTREWTCLHARAREEAPALHAPAKKLRLIPA
jgi:hypothetical protein